MTKQRPRSLIIEGTSPEVTIVDSYRYDPDLEMPYIHFNTSTWDTILAQRPVTAPGATPVAA